MGVMGVATTILKITGPGVAVNGKLYNWIFFCPPIHTVHTSLAKLPPSPPRLPMAASDKAHPANTQPPAKPEITRRKA